jgi:hypothetical protein
MPVAIDNEDGRRDVVEDLQNKAAEIADPGSRRRFL